MRSLLAQWMEEGNDSARIRVSPKTITAKNGCIHGALLKGSIKAAIFEKLLSNKTLNYPCFRFYWTLV